MMNHEEKYTHQLFFHICTKLVLPKNSLYESRRIGFTFRLDLNLIKPKSKHAITLNNLTQLLVLKFRF